MVRQEDAVLVLFRMREVMRTGTGRPVDQSVKRDRTYFTFTNYALNFCIDYIKMNMKYWRS